MFPNLIPKDREFFFSGDVDQKSISKLNSQLIEVINSDIQLRELFPIILKQQYSPPAIRIFIDSYGGDVFSCLGATSIINASTTPIHTIVTGCAMSAGFVIAICGHKRFCYENSTFMYHELSSGQGGTLQEQKEGIEEDEKTQGRIDSLVLKKTNITKQKLDFVNKKKKDWYIHPREAMKLGVVDHIIKNHSEIFN